MAGRSQAHRNEMFPSGCQTECPIEGGDTIEVNQRVSRLLRNDPQSFLGEITVLGLNFFEKRNKPCLVSVTVIVYHFFYLLGIHETPSSKNLALSIFITTPNSSLGFRIDAGSPLVAVTAQALIGMKGILPG